MKLAVESQHFILITWQGNNLREYKDVVEQPMRGLTSMIMKEWVDWFRIVLPD